MKLVNSIQEISWRPSGLGGSLSTLLVIHTRNARKDAKRLRGILGRMATVRPNEPKYNNVVYVRFERKFSK